MRDAICVSESKFDFPQFSLKRFKKLFFVGCYLRTFDIGKIGLSLKVEHDWEAHELYLQIRCKNLSCLKSTIVDSSAFVYPHGSIFLSNSLVCRSVDIEDFCHRNFATDKLYEIFTETSNEGVRQMEF